MPNIIFNNTTVAALENETVLDALLRSGHDISNGCRAGACQSCLLVAKDTQLPAKATHGLSDSAKALGIFKSCCHVPTQDIHVAHSQDLIKSIPAKIIEKSMLNASVIRIRLESEFEYRAGQYVSLWKDSKLARSYSIASVKGVDNYLEFHIKHYPDGAFSHWIFDHADCGTNVNVQGPLGACFYTPTNDVTNLLLLASGTGLAPLYGIVRDALIQQHQGKIHLLVAAKKEEDFYYLDELQQLADEYEQFDFELIALQSNSANIQQADVYEYVKQQYSALKGYRVYICGGGNFVQKLKKQCFLAGANMNEIFTDSFLSFSNT